MKRLSMVAITAAMLPASLLTLPAPTMASVPTCYGRSATIVGTDASDTIVGTARRDVIVARAGNDHIDGRGGDDLICAGTGADVVGGGSGADRISGESGADQLWGGDGADELAGGPGDDRLRGGPGVDRIAGGDGLDLCLSPAPPIATRCENTVAVVGADEAAGDAGTPAISADGRYVAFASHVKVDTRDQVDVFVRDLQSRTLTQVSVSSQERPGNGWYAGTAPAISKHGRFVTFTSESSNLVTGDTNHAADALLRDRETGTTSRVSVSSSGHQGNADSGGTAISADGRYVAFSSSATNLVPGDTNGGWDVFVRDRRTGVTSRVSVGNRGQQANNAGDFSTDSNPPAISADGRYVAFLSRASNLVPGDTNGCSDVFVRDRIRATTTRVSVSSSERQSNCPVPPAEAWPAISADGRYVAFVSTASNLVAGDTNRTWDVFVRDRRAGTTTRVSVSSGGQQQARAAENPIGDRPSPPTMTADGRYIAFTSAATNLVPGDTSICEYWEGEWVQANCVDVFVRDRVAKTTSLGSLTSSGAQADGDSYSPSISADGRYVAFTRRYGETWGGILLRILR